MRTPAGSRKFFVERLTPRLDRSFQREPSCAGVSHQSARHRGLFTLDPRRNVRVHPRPPRECCVPALRSTCETPCRCPQDLRMGFHERDPTLLGEPAEGTLLAETWFGHHPSQDSDSRARTPSATLALRFRIAQKAPCMH